MIPIPALSPTMWIAVGAGLLILSLSGALYVQGARLDTCKAEHAAFVAKVEAIGKAQEAAAKLKDDENKTRMEKADAENLRTKSALTVALNSLRDSRPSSSFVPQAPAGAKRPDLICFERAEYQRAFGSLVEGARRLADEGTAATVDLNSARRWAQELAR